jgi:lysophospholipase L1-like esterase
MPWLKAVDVRAAAPTTAIVAFGDSITDGTCTTLDGHDRWEDVVAQRLALQGSSSHSVVNEGIGGNTVTRNVTPPPDTTPGTERLDRDVLAHAGVSHVVVTMGTNDIRREASADQVIDGLKDIVARVKAHGLKSSALPSSRATTLRQSPAIPAGTTPKPRCETRSMPGFEGAAPSTASSISTASCAAPRTPTS